MSEEKDFFERCFGIVAGLEVKNEAQAIAKEVVLSEIENLQQELTKYKNIISDLEFAIKSNCIKLDDKYQEICCDGDYLLAILEDKEKEWKK